MMFTLDNLDEIEDVQPSTMNTHSSNVQNQSQEQDEDVIIETQKRTFEEIDEDPTEAPISNSLSKTIEERRARLKQYNYKFKSVLKDKSIDELESMPAYKRQGLELTDRKSTRLNSSHVA